MKLLAVALLLLPLSVCWAEVVDDFTVSCPQFFITQNGVVSPPTTFTGNRYKNICQTLNGQIEFATFYDTANRIPVYSAYRFYGRVNCSRQDAWFIEPQLDELAQGGNMASESKSIKGLGVHQALNSDYAYQGHDKGHLAPVYQQNMQNCADATFTLTNAAPQIPTFNRGQWKAAEKNITIILNNTCGQDKYIVTGVVPGSATIKNRVRVPSHFWSAYCCLDNNQRRHSGGYIGENNRNNVVQYRTRQQLEGDLSTLYKQNFMLFGGGC